MQSCYMFCPVLSIIFRLLLVAGLLGIFHETGRVLLLAVGENS